MATLVTKFSTDKILEQITAENPSYADVFPQETYNLINQMNYDARVGYKKITPEQAQWFTAFAYENLDNLSYVELAEVYKGLNMGLSLDDMNTILESFDDVLDVKGASWRISLLNTMVLNGHSVEETKDILYPDLADNRDYALREQQVREFIKKDDIFQNLSEKEETALRLFFLDFAMKQESYRKRLTDEETKVPYIQLRTEGMEEFLSRMDTEDGRAYISDLLKSVSESDKMTKYYHLVAENIEKSLFKGDREKDAVIEDIIANGLKDFVRIDTERKSDINPNYTIKESFLVLNHYKNDSMEKPYEGIMLLCEDGSHLFLTGYSEQEKRNFFSQFDKISSNHNLDDGQYNLLKSRIVDCYATNGFMQFKLDEKEVFPYLKKDHPFDFQWLKQQGMWKFYQTHETIHLSYKGLDSWSRPCFECMETGDILTDVSLGREKFPDFHTTVANVIGGEPDSPARLVKYNVEMDYGIKEGDYLRCNKNYIDEHNCLQFIKGNYYPVEWFSNSLGNDTFYVQQTSYTIKGLNHMNLTCIGINTLRNYFDIYERTTQEIAKSVNVETIKVDFGSRDKYDNPQGALVYHEYSPFDSPETDSLYGEYLNLSDVSVKIPDLPNKEVRLKSYHVEKETGFVVPDSWSTEAVMHPIENSQKETDCLDYQHTISCMYLGNSLSYEGMENDLSRVDMSLMTPEKIASMAEELDAVTSDLKDGLLNPEAIGYADKASSLGNLKELKRTVQEYGNFLEGKSAEKTSDKPAHKKTVNDKSMAQNHGNDSRRDSVKKTDDRNEH